MPRIRLQSCAPLPSLKVWFFVPNNTPNIWVLKSMICSQLPTLKDTELQPEQLTLEMDGFEILNESPVDLVREVDVVMLKKREAVTKAAHVLKRKSNVEDTISIEAKRRKISSTVIPSTSKSSSISSSSDSDTTTSSDSEATTSTDSETSTSSESSSIDTNFHSNSSSHPVLSASATKEKQTFKTVTSPMTNRHMMRSTPLPVVQQITVPPGCGKPSTQARNRRRKLKRKFAADNGTPRTASVSVCIPDLIDDKEEENTPVLPYGHSVPVSTPVLSSLGNRNKRKGFKKSMEGTLPGKLVFDSTTVPSFIPPSERKVLPHNLFVTSVDVEWRTGRGRWQDVEEVEARLAPEIKTAQSGNGEQESQKGIDWTAIEGEWKKYPKIEAITEVPLGSIVAWKGFGIDPMTLTPQATLLHLGKVMAGDTETLTVSLLARPDIGPATFGRAEVNGETDDEPVDQVSTPLTEIWSGDWRVVSNE